jgi:hypothetical protein
MIYLHKILKSSFFSFNIGDWTEGFGILLAGQILYNLIHTFITLILVCFLDSVSHFSLSYFGSLLSYLHLPSS